MDVNSTLKISTPSDREVVLTRTFSASRSLVFDALTKPELLRRWYGPTGWTLDVCDIDLKVGGAWRFVVKRPDGKAIGQKGLYQEIVPSERIVNTESWEDWDAGECLVTTVLREEDGMTKFSSTILFPSQEVRDTVVKSGLEHGAAEGYAKLEQLLEMVSVTQMES
ncbi:MAG TPA: SRPBCC family protein [Pyrinomonadaceae bacterium]|nr:SRPBCC family protein [Pyrinomonadaceae bacterium]